MLALSRYVILCLRVLIQAGQYAWRIWYRYPSFSATPSLHASATCQLASQSSPSIREFQGKTSLKWPHKISLEVAHVIEFNTFSADLALYCVYALSAGFFLTFPHSHLIPFQLTPGVLPLPLPLYIQYYDSYFSLSAHTRFNCIFTIPSFVPSCLHFSVCTHFFLSTNTLLFDSPYLTFSLSCSQFCLYSSICTRIQSKSFLLPSRRPAKISLHFSGAGYGDSAKE